VDSYIVLKNPDGGFGLRARTVEIAHERILRLLALGKSKLTALELEVEEPCEARLHPAIDKRRKQELKNERLAGLAALVKGSGHELDPLAHEAWVAFGLPQDVSTTSLPGVAHVRWCWRKPHERDLSDRANAPVARDLDAWLRFVGAKQALSYGDRAPRVQLRSTWSLLLPNAGASRTVPPGSVTASFAGAHSCAQLDLVFPYGESGPALDRAFASVGEALALKIPRSALRLNAPTEKGTRKQSKVRS